MPKWQLAEQDGITFYRLSADEHTIGYFFTRCGGVSRGVYAGLNLSPDVGDDPECVRENYARVKALLGVKAIAVLKQVHSTEIVLVGESGIAEATAGDGLVVYQKDIALAVKVADCLPVYAWNDAAIGIAHAGWRGTLAGIAEKLAAEISGRGAGVNYAFGPSIGGKCYEVGAEVAQRIGSASSCLRRADSDRFLFDLKAFNRARLVKLGAREQADLNECTHCRADRFYSARRDGVTGRNLAVIVRR